MKLAAHLQFISDRCQLLKDDLLEIETDFAEFKKLPRETQEAIHAAMRAQEQLASALHKAARVAVAGSL